MQTNGMDNLFSDIIAEKFPNLGNNMDIQIGEAHKRQMERAGVVAQRWSVAYHV